MELRQSIQIPIPTELIADSAITAAKIANGTIAGAEMAPNNAVMTQCIYVANVNQNITPTSATHKIIVHFTATATQNAVPAVNWSVTLQDGAGVLLTQTISANGGAGNWAFPVAFVWKGVLNVAAHNINIAIAGGGALGNPSLLIEEFTP